VSIQPDLDALNAARVVDKVFDLAALGWAIEKAETRGEPIPEHRELHRRANKWMAAHGLPDTRCACATKETI